MSIFSSYDQLSCTCLCGGAVLGVALVVTCSYWFTRSSSCLIPNAPPNTVLHHQPDRGPYAPNLVLFAVRLETYLRMAKIPYKIVPGMRLSSKGRVPWMEYNGDVCSDSASCIRYLNKKLDIDLNKGLSGADRGVAKAVQRLTEEHLFWFSESFPWVLESETNMIPQMMRMNRLVKVMAGRWMRNQTRVQGVGRHTLQEQAQLIEEDLQALSEILEQFPSLCQYCERMKTTYWPDWEECIRHGIPWG